MKRLTKDPDELCCSISAALFEYPVVADDGNTYELQGIKDWLRKHRPPTSPLTGKRLESAPWHVERNCWKARRKSWKGVSHDLSLFVLEPPLAVSGDRKQNVL